MAGLLDQQRGGVGGLLGGQPRQQGGGLMALSEPQKAGVFDYVLATLAGGGLSGAASLGLQQRQQQRAFKGQQAGLEQLAQSADAAGLSAAERFALRLNPQSALDMLAKRSEPQKVSGGDSLYIDGKYTTAPKLGMDGGYGYSQTPEATTWQAQRGINHKEVEDERANMADEDQAKAALAETARSNRVDESLGFGQLGVSRGQLGVAQSRLALDRSTAVPGGKPTEGQATAGFNAARLAQAEKTLKAMEGGGYNASLGMAGGGLDKARSYDQAANEWSDAIIRLTTGAAATKDEISMARKTYFPQLGDSPAIRQQKAASRTAVMQEAARRAGPAAPQAKVRTYNPATGKLE